MADTKEESKSVDAREASKSRVVTLETLVNKPEIVEPTSQEPEDKDKTVTKDSTEPISGEAKQENKPKIKTAQERIQELARRRKEAEKAAEDVKRENEELRARLRSLEANLPEIKQESRPQRMSFADEDSYIDALTDWKTKKVIADREKEAQEAKIAANSAEVSSRYIKTVELAKAKYDDFEKVVGNARIAVPPIITMTLQESQIGGELTYYLAKHEDEIRKLVDLATSSPVKAVKYLDKLERDFLIEDEELEAEKEAEKPSGKSAVKKASETINPVKGTIAPLPAAATSFDEYRARRQAQKGSRRR